MKYTIKQFRTEYPNDDVCLEKIFKLRYHKLEACPKCATVNAEFKRIPTRRCFQCVECGHQLYPTAGTIFDKTTTPLTHWFFVIYMMSVTRNGVSGKEIERALGVSYKTAWRIGHQIRQLMGQRYIGQLKGEVIIDETYIGGQERFKHKNKRKKIQGYVGKTPVFAMMEKGGKVIVGVINENKLDGKIIKPIIRHHINSSATLVTDGFGAYNGLKNEYAGHEVVNHEKDEYVNSNGFSTNAIEGYFSGLKRMIRGTHLHVSVQHLPKYIAENNFRYENRETPDKMFDIILSQVV